MCWLSPHTRSLNTAAAQGGQAERYNRDLQAHDSHCSSVYCREVVAYLLLTIMFDGNLAERQRSRHLSLPDTSMAVGGWNIGIGKTE